MDGRGGDRCGKAWRCRAGCGGMGPAWRVPEGYGKGASALRRMVAVSANSGRVGSGKERLSVARWGQARHGKARVYFLIPF